MELKDLIYQSQILGNGCIDDQLSSRSPVACSLALLCRRLDVGERKREDLPPSLKLQDLRQCWRRLCESTFHVPRDHASALASFSINEVMSRRDVQISEQFRSWSDEYLVGRQSTFEEIGVTHIENERGRHLQTDECYVH